MLRVQFPPKKLTLWQFGFTFFAAGNPVVTAALLDVSAVNFSYL